MRWHNSGRCWGGILSMSCSRPLPPQDEDTLQAGLGQLVAAELLYQRGRPPRARYMFKHALIQDAVYASLLKSTRQRAKSLELRAAMSLAHLWQQQGKTAEARALLAPIYGWFTEGFDTADLQEAKVLLETLA